MPRTVNPVSQVLIPVFALGRAQELCILLETYWERNNLKVPIYFAMGLTEKANEYYKLFISWTNEKIKRTFVERNMFEFRHILPFDRGYVDAPGPQVLFATPGMLHAGLSLFVFKKWAPDPKNMVIMPGYVFITFFLVSILWWHLRKCNRNYSSCPCLLSSCAVPPPTARSADRQLF